jgi:hypothetical protein
MITLDKKGKLPNYNGGQPPNPRDLTHCEPKHVGQAEICRHCPMLQLPDAALGSLLSRCPILRPGSGILSKSVKSTSNQTLKYKKWRLKTAFGNWIKFDWIIHPILTLTLSKKLS